MVFRPQRLVEDPDTPTVFPRNSWPDGRCFGSPPYRPGEHMFEACWAASEASMEWSRALGRPTQVDDEGTPCDEPAPRPDSTVDATCFMLAVFDKAYEIVWYALQPRVARVRKPPLSYLEWTMQTDDVIYNVYDTACATPGPEERPAVTDVYWFARDALDLWAFAWELSAAPPPPPAGYVPFPIAVLGRFAAAYMDHEYWSFSGEPEPPTRHVKPAKQPAPAPGQPVEEGEAYRAAGLERALQAKDAYNEQRERFFAEFERQVALEDERLACECRERARREREQESLERERERRERERKRERELERERRRAERNFPCKFFGLKTPKAPNAAKTLTDPKPPAARSPTVAQYGELTLYPSQRPDHPFSLSPTPTPSRATLGERLPNVPTISQPSPACLRHPNRGGTIL